MKKATAFLVIISLILTFYMSNTFAQPVQLVYDGAVHEYSGSIYNIKINGELVPTDMPPVIIENRTLVPARAVFEKIGANVSWDGANQKVSLVLNDTSMEFRINDSNVKVNDKTVQLDVPAKIINDRTMLPLRFVGEQLNMKVGWFPNEALVTLDRTNAASDAQGIKSVQCTQKDNMDVVTVSLDGAKNYNAFRLSAPDRIVVDIANTVIAAKQQKIDVNSTYVKSVRYAQFNDTTVRLVLDVSGQPDYQIENKTDQLVLNVGASARKDDSQSRGNLDRDRLPATKDLNVSYKQKDNEDEVSINIADYKGYNVMRLSDPDRLIVDIPGFNQPFPEQRIDINSTKVKSIRYAKFNASTVRVVIDTNAQMHYLVDPQDGKLVLHIQNPAYRNIFYHNNVDNVYFAMPKVKLANGSNNQTRLYKESYDQANRKYTVTFPANLADLGNGGVMNINDNMMDSLSIISNQFTNETSIAFYSKKDVKYEVSQKTESDNSITTVIRPVQKFPDFSGRLVVIDPGHGGSETGAVYGSLLEKNLNLDIARRVNVILKSKNVKTYMTREDDSYVDLYDRPNTANSMKAALFLSVHNNANDGNSKGTETLYRPSDPEDGRFTSRRFAQIIQDKLISTLGTIDRKTVPRPNLVVLKYTTMPAALAEISFLDNKDDRDNLLNDDFRQRAAAAIADAVIQALSELK